MASKPRSETASRGGKGLRRPGLPTGSVGQGGWIGGRLSAAEQAEKSVFVEVEQSPAV